MKQYQTVYRGKEAFRKTLTQWKSPAAHALIHLFADGTDPAEVTAACDILDELMPHAVYVGASASGYPCHPWDPAPDESGKDRFLCYQE